MKRYAGISFVFVLGCVAGGVAGRIAVPAAQAQSTPPAVLSASGATPPRWEYFCELDITKARLADAGAKGWELVAAPTVVAKTTGSTASSETRNDVNYCFKRPLP